MDSLLFSAPFSKGAFGVFWTDLVDSVRTGVSFVAKLWCRLRYVLFTPEFLVDKSPKMWHNTMRGCALRAVQCTVPPSYFACVAQLVEQLTRNEQVAGSSPATSSRLLACNARSFSMCKSSDNRYTMPMKNAEASVRMEGCQVTPQMREQCRRVLRGEVTTAELLQHFSKPAER